MADYNLLSYHADANRIRPGMLIDGRVHDLPEALGAASVIDVLADWDAANARLHEAAGKLDAGSGKPLAEVRLAAPVIYPPAIFCAGANYWKHAREMLARQGQDPATMELKRSAEPWFFIKTSAHSVIGPGDDIVLPPFSKQIDWEAEIAVVIGKGGRNLTEERAMEAVAGFTILNDLSARDLSRRTDTAFELDWLGQKCFEGAAPMGPWITPLDQIPDVYDMDVKLWVGDELMQDSNSSDLVHNFHEMVAYLSRHMRLRPGDVIGTGTPSGVGMPRGRFLKPGETVRISVEGVGELTNNVVQG